MQHFKKLNDLFYESKKSDLDQFVQRNEEVVWFEIAMNDAPVMNKAKTFNLLNEDFKNFLICKPFFVANRSNRTGFPS